MSRDARVLASLDVLSEAALVHEAHQGDGVRERLRRVWMTGIGIDWWARARCRPVHRGLFGPELVEREWLLPADLARAERTRRSVAAA